MYHAPAGRPSRASSPTNLHPMCHQGRRQGHLHDEGERHREDRYPQGHRSRRRDRRPLPRTHPLGAAPATRPQLTAARGGPSLADADTPHQWAPPGPNPAPASQTQPSRRPAPGISAVGRVPPRAPRAVHRIRRRRRRRAARAASAAGPTARPADDAHSTSRRSEPRGPARARVRGL
jgi:hypothetical protein